MYIQNVQSSQAKKNIANKEVTLPILLAASNAILFSLISLIEVLLKNKLRFLCWQFLLSSIVYVKLFFRFYYTLRRKHLLLIKHRDLVSKNNLNTKLTNFR